MSQVTAERARKSTDPVDFPEILVVSTEGERELTVSTGYFIDQPEAWLRYLDELVLSEEIYLVTDQGHEPVRRTTSELTDFTDGVYMNSRNVYPGQTGQGAEL